LEKGHSRKEGGKYEPLLLVERADLPWNRKKGRFYYSRFDPGPTDVPSIPLLLKIVVNI